VDSCASQSMIITPLILAIVRFSRWGYNLTSAYISLWNSQITLLCLKRECYVYGLFFFWYNQIGSSKINRRCFRWQDSRRWKRPFTAGRMRLPRSVRPSATTPSHCRRKPTRRSLTTCRSYSIWVTRSRAMRSCSFSTKYVISPAVTINSQN